MIVIVAAIFWHEAFPSLPGILWAMIAGVSGALGIAAFYRGLSIAPAATVAPTAGVIGAALPVVFAGFTEGLPAPLKLLGFGLAFAGIWLVSVTPSDGQEGTSGQEGTFGRPGFLLACLAGIGFAGFFICIGQVDAGKLFTTVIIARSVALLTGLVLIKINRLPLPSLSSSPLALLTGVLDVAGNLLYLLAKQFTRLDIAVVLGSLYPAVTVFLSSLIFKEKVSRSQWLGIVICLAAIGLITI